MMWFLRWYVGAGDVGQSAHWDIASVGGIASEEAFGGPGITTDDRIGGGRGTPRHGPTYKLIPARRPFYIVGAGGIETQEAFGLPGIEPVLSARSRRQREDELFQLAA